MKLEKLRVDVRVRSKANPAFVGSVIEAAEDGLSGYVRFDGDDAEAGRIIFFHVDELEQAPK